MNGNIRVGNLFGIPFYVNPSWFFVLALVSLSYGEQLAFSTRLDGIIPYFLGFVTAILLFASVLAHELGHSFVAIAQGIEVKSITLFLFGGLAALDKESDTPLQAFLVAIAGPVVSILLFVSLTLINIHLALPPVLQLIITFVASINLVLAVFNLLPGLPLDGGNIVKALVWKITGNPNKGVIFASRVGQFLGWLAVITGILAVLRISPIGNFWTLLIGGFLLQNAGFSARAAKAQETLSGFTAADAVMADSPIVPSDLTLREFANEYVIGKNKWKKFLVTNYYGQLLGQIDVDQLKTVSTSLWTEVTIRQIMQPLEDIQTIKADLSLLEVVKLLEKQDSKQLTVVGDNDIVLGLLERESIINLLQQKAMTQPQQA